MRFESFDSANKSKEHVPSIPLKEFAQLDSDVQSEIVTETFQELRSALTEHGFDEYKEITEMYRSLPAEQLIVRREDPDTVNKLLNEGAIEIAFDGNVEYANSVEWSPENGPQHIRNAYLEGYGQKNSIVTVIGIHKNDTLSVKKLEDSTQEFYGLDRTGVRSAKGTVSLDDLHFVSIRIPINYLQESELTENELDERFEYTEFKKAGKQPSPVFVHRGFLRKSESEN